MSGVTPSSEVLLGTCRRASANAANAMGPKAASREPRGPLSRRAMVHAPRAEVHGRDGCPPSADLIDGHWHPAYNPTKRQEGAETRLLNLKAA